MRTILPLPPTSNHMYKIFGNRMYKAKAYLDWLEVCAAQLRDEPKIVGPARVLIEVRRGKGLRVDRDLDNMLKCTLDLLKPEHYGKDGKRKHHGAGVMVDDSIEYVVEIVARVLPAHDKKSAAEFWLTVSPAGPSGRSIGATS
jgi:Holliday junction resolvase RusA-like endonuclease